MRGGRKNIEEEEPKYRHLVVLLVFYPSLLKASFHNAL